MISKDLYHHLSPTPASLGEKSVFCGLQVECQRLCGELGQGRAVAIASAPGMGKSSLLIQAAKLLQPKRRVYMVYSGDVKPEGLLSQIPKNLIKNARKSVLVIDDLDKADPKDVQELLIRLRPVLSLRFLASGVALPEALGAQAEDIVSGERPAPLLGIFSHIMRLEPMSESALMEILAARLGLARGKKRVEAFADAEALRLALAASRGVPQRWLHILREGTQKAGTAGKEKLGFNEIYDVLRVPYRLDLTFKRILFMLAKKGTVSGLEKDLLSFCALDRKSLHRRLDLLEEKRLVEILIPGPDRLQMEFRLRPTQVPEKPLVEEKAKPEETGFETMHS